MGSIFKFLGFIFFVLVIAGVVFGIKGYGVMQDGLAYLQDKQPQIIEHWDPAAFIPEAAPKLQDAMPRRIINQDFAAYRQLGAFVSADDPKPMKFRYNTSPDGRRWYAFYQTKAEYQGGSAIIFVELVKMDDGWKFNNLTVWSEAFSKALAAATPTPKPQFNGFNHPAAPATGARSPGRSSPFSGFSNPLDSNPRGSRGGGPGNSGPGNPLDQPAH
jgi:hypothetical protein